MFTKSISIIQRKLNKHYKEIDKHREQRIISGKIQESQPKNEYWIWKLIFIYLLQHYKSCLSKEPNLTF